MSRDQIVGGSSIIEHAQGAFRRLCKLGQPLLPYRIARLQSDCNADYLSSTVHLRYRVTVKGVTADWSDAISIIVE